jgi:RNA polymerase sigma factor (sigma-70 family)
MVMRVCRNALGQEQADLHDAFQATFLILVRKSRSIRRLDSVGSWLFGVATRVARRARVEAARRRSAERRGGLRIAASTEHSSSDPTDIQDLGPLLQADVERLPKHLRAVVILCYWEGLTHEQAAARLGCPLGTVRSRVARARGLLHRRLSRRGLEPVAGVMLAAFDSPEFLKASAVEIPAAVQQARPHPRRASETGSLGCCQRVTNAGVASKRARTVPSGKVRTRPNLIHASHYAGLFRLAPCVATLYLAR